SRQRRLAFDHLEHRLLLAEEIFVGTRDDGDRAVATEPCARHLLDGARHRVDLPWKGGLDADERLDGLDRERVHDDAFDELVRVGAHEGAVLEGRGLAFGAVAGDVAMAAWLIGDGAPLAARAEAG